MAKKRQKGGKGAKASSRATAREPAKTSLSTIKLEDVRLVCQYWKKMHDEGAKDCKEADESIRARGGRGDKNPAALAKRVNRHFGYKLFDRGCKHVRAASEPIIRRVMLAVDWIDQSLPRNHRDPRIQLRLGVGHSLAMEIAPRIVGRFRATPAGQTASVEVIVDYSEKLAERFAQGELDVVLSAVPLMRTIMPFPATARFIKDLKNLSGALIAPLNHPIIKTIEEDQNSKLILSNTTALKYLDIDGVQIHVFNGRQAAIDMVQAPLSWKHARFVPQSSYAIINGVVANGIDLGVTIPHFLTRDQRLRLDVVPFDDSFGNQLKTELVAVSLDLADPERANLVDEISRRGQGKPEHTYLTSLNAFKRVCKDIIQDVIKQEEVYLKQTRDRKRLIGFLELPDQHQGRAWFAGDFQYEIELGADFKGRFEITHMLGSKEWELLPERHRRYFQLSGAIDRDKKNKAHIIAIGKERRANKGVLPRDAFCISIFEMDALDGAAAIGGANQGVKIAHWSGREVVPAGRPRSFAPSDGFAIVASGGEVSVLRQFDKTRLDRISAIWSKQPYVAKSTIAPAPHSKPAPKKVRA